NTQNQNGYMLLFRGTDLRRGLSPEELQKVSEDWMAWFKRLTEQGKAVAGNPLEREGKIVSGKGGGFSVDRSPNPRKPLAAIFFSTAPRWTKRSPSPGNVPVCHMAYAWKS